MYRPTYILTDYISHYYEVRIHIEEISPEEICIYPDCLEHSSINIEQLFYLKLQPSSFPLSQPRALTHFMSFSLSIEIIPLLQYAAEMQWSMREWA